VLRLVSDESADFAARRENVLTDKRDGLFSVLAALTGFTHNVAHGPIVRRLQTRPNPPCLLIG
jgi:hypothetical protein